MQIPEEWPWEEAKEVFMKPDVTPADEIEVDAFPFLALLSLRSYQHLCVTA